MANHRDWDIIVLQNIRTAGYNSAQVESLKFSQICELAEVDLEAVPEQFFYQLTRNRIVNLLRDEEKAAVVEAKRLKLEQAIKTDSTLSDTTVLLKDNEFVIYTSAVEHI